MDLLRRWLISDAIPTADEQAAVEESERELAQTRGEYRQAVLRVEANVRVIRSWENANKWVRE